MPPLSRELFARMGESLHYPHAAMPVMLRGEFDSAIAGRLTPDALLDLARQAGLESATISRSAWRAGATARPALFAVFTS